MEELSGWPYNEKPGRRERFGDRSDVCYLDQGRNHYENVPRVRPNVLRTHSCNFEIVDDRVRDDKRSEIRRISNLESTKNSIGSKSIGSQTNRKKSNPSIVVRPFKDVLGETYEPRRLVKPDDSISSKGQTRVTSSSCSGSVGGKQSPQMIVNLMDFGFEPETVGPQTQEETKSSDADNGASGSSNFESLLFAFSDPLTPADTTYALHNACDDTATTSNATNITATKSMPCFQSANWVSPDLPAKSNTISRQELPEDLFSSSYNWQGVNTHNNYTMHVATSSNSTESRNPFDLDDDDILAYNSMVCKILISL
ncbi:uncharacterized protein LOC124924302 [Impatiens glandulifera]|uniref:uncharacterized protein LOC124924302 n=1 Tax=Impatiens glandulifera TaxID=253017 RepID=UPI001FB0AAD3|nr:uncharacterized protein LOC124924302 [Impatiens glandulifera]